MTDADAGKRESLSGDQTLVQINSRSIKQSVRQVQHVINYCTVCF